MQRDDRTGWSEHGGIVPPARPHVAHPSALGRWCRDHQLPILIVAAVVVFLAGAAGPLLDGSAHGDVLGAAYGSLQLFVLHGPHFAHVHPLYQAARFLAPAVGFSAALLAFASLLREQLGRWRLRRYRDHVVVCGLGYKGLPLVEEYRAAGFRVVGIEPNETGSQAEACREVGAQVLLGDARDDATLRHARAAQASEVFCVSTDDAYNAEIALRCRALHAAAGPAGRTGVRCYVHTMDQPLRRVLEDGLTGTEAGTGRFSVKLFSIFDSSARLLFLEHPLETFLPPDRVPGSEVHLVVAGFRGMGTHVALQAARVCHFADGARLRITVVDAGLPARLDSFRRDFPQFDRVAKVGSYRARVEDGEDLVRAVAAIAEEHPVHAVYVCFDQDALSFRCGVALRRAHEEVPLPVFVRMTGEAGLAGLIESPDAPVAQGYPIRAFGAVRPSCSRHVVVEESVERRFHEAYLRMVDDGKGRDPAKASHREWPDLPETFKASNRHQVDHVPVKLRAVGCVVRPRASGDRPPFQFEEGEVDRLARMEHSRWVAERFLDGWTPSPPGSKPDHVAKTHPDLVPWDQLDVPIQAIDRRSVRDIPVILDRLGLDIVRAPRG